MRETETDAAGEGPSGGAEAGAARGGDGGGAAGFRPALWRRYAALPPNVLWLSVVSLLNDASSEIVSPFLPLFLVAIGASRLAIGLIEGGPEAVSALLKLFAGYFSDRRGRRKGLVVFGYVLASAMRPLLAWAASWRQVLIIRLVDRVGKGLRSAPRDAMIADAAQPSERGLAFGFQRAMDHAGAVVGPLIGYAILSLVASDKNAPTPTDYRTLFLLASVPATAAVLVAVFLVREARREQRVAARELEQPRLSLRGFDSNFKRFLAVLALFTLSNSSDALLLLRAREAGVGAATIPLLWAALHVVKVFGSLVFGDLSDRLGRKRLIVAGWLLYAAVYAGFAFVSSVGEAWILFLVYGVYFGMVEGAERALVADLVRPEQRGTAFGLYNLAFSVTVLPASLLLGALWDWRGARFAFLLSACLSAAAALLLAAAVRPAASAHAGGAGPGAHMT